MPAIAVGALHDHDVGRAVAFRVAQDRRVVLPDVATEDDARARTLLLELQPHAGGAEDVAGVAEGQRHAGQHLGRATVRHRLELLDRLVRVHSREQRIGKATRVSIAVFGLLAAVALRLALGHEGAVREQDAREVAARRGRVDRSAEPALAQQRQPPAVIDVRVAQHHRVDRCGIERKRLPIADVGLIAALDQPAVEQQRAAANGEDVAGTGDFTGRAVELQVHRANRLRRFAARRPLRLPGGSERPSPARPAAA